MARMVQCVKLGKEAEGMKFPPLPNALGTKTASASPTRAPANIWRNKWKATFSATAQTKCKATFPLTNPNRQPENSLHEFSCKE